MLSGLLNNMVENLKLYYHVMVQLIFISGVVWQISNMTDEMPDDRYIADIIEYKERYFTMWNVAIQFIYFGLVTIEDLDVYKSKKSFITRIKTYLFFSLVFPCSAMVSTGYWILYHYDRELILPKSADFYCMKYSNQVVHTSIIIFPLLEYYFMNNKSGVSFKSCFITLTALHIIYYAVFFYHYFTIGRYLYPIFHCITWYQKIILILTLYAICLFAAKLGIIIQEYMRKIKLEGFTSSKDIKSS